MKWFWQKFEKRYDEGWYIGEGITVGDDQIRQGRGIMIWNEGSIYEGTWKKDKMHGVGRIIHPGFYYYEGQWH